MLNKESPAQPENWAEYLTRISLASLAVVAYVIAFYEYAGPYMVNLPFFWYLISNFGGAAIIGHSVGRAIARRGQRTPK